MRSLPIFFACVSTWRYRDRRAATPTVTRFSATRAPSVEEVCNMHEPLCPRLGRTVRVVTKSLRRPEFVQPPAQRLLVDEVDERALAGDLDDGQPLTVALLEVGDAGDVHLRELERH